MRPYKILGVTVSLAAGVLVWMLLGAGSGACSQAIFAASPTRVLAKREW